jgi:ferric-dicitrate binding protein FerR (iron transport regulator)
MPENKKEKLKYLLARYTGKQIACDELSELKALVNWSDNDELAEPLHELWMNGDYASCLPTEPQKIRMIRQVEQAIKKENRSAVLPPHRHFFRAFRRIAALLVLALLSGICVYLYRSNRNLTVYRNNEIVLHVGNGQEAGFTLPDGTVVRLNSGSTIAYDNNFGENSRLVRFSGEAFFEVKPDRKRPFIVSTKYLDVEAIGTSFNVYAFDTGDLLEVALLSGSVKVSSKKNPQSPVFIRPNEKVIGRIPGDKLTVQASNIRYEMAWLNGETVFKSETLSNVLAKLERKYGVHIRYEGNPGLLADRFSGRIGKDNNIGDALLILTKHYPLKYERKNDRFVLSDRKPE